MENVHYIKEEFKEEKKVVAKTNYIKEAVVMGAVLVASVWLTNVILGGTSGAEDSKDPGNSH